MAFFTYKVLNDVNSSNNKPYQNKLTGSSHSVEKIEQSISYMLLSRFPMLFVLVMSCPAEIVQSFK